MHYIGLTDKQLVIFNKLNTYMERYKYVFEAVGIHIPFTCRISLTQVGRHEGSDVCAIDEYDLSLLAKLFFGAAETPTTVEFNSSTGVYSVIDAVNGSEKVIGVQEFINLFTESGVLNLRRKPRYSIYLKPVVYPSYSRRLEWVRGDKSDLVFLSRELVGRPARRRVGRKNKKRKNNDS